MESKYMTLEKYAATLKVGDEVTIEYHSMAGDRQTIEKILKITKSGTIYLRSTNCKDAIRFRKNGQWLDNFGYQGGLISGYSLKNPYKNPGVQNEKIYVNIQPKPREIDRIHQQILYAPRLANHQHSKR